MSITALQALNAYTQAAQTGGVGDPTGVAAIGGGDNAAKGSDFAAMMKDAIGSATSASVASEKLTIASTTGQAELVDVVTAVSAAEIQLQTVIAVRDEMIKAYQNILRMPI
jgi:flagellar hook-basal body complex protein FliE